MATGTELHTLAVATDSRLADLHGQRAVIQERFTRSANTIKQYAGAERNDWGIYKMTLDEAETIIATVGFKPSGPVAWWGRPGGDIDEARGVIAGAQAELTGIDTEIAECNDIWQTNGCWDRFFMVPGGHIHSSMSCSTCNNGHDLTTFGWLPDLSGLTEADAVAAHGALLCTVCYPSAPVEWTNHYETEAAAKKSAQCPGSGSYDYDPATARLGFYSGNYGVCAHCGRRVTATKTCKLRAHNPVQEVN